MTKKFKMRKPTERCDVEHYVHEIDFPKYKKGEKVVLFDGDILAFKVASVCEYRFRFTSKSDPDDVVLAKSITEFKASLEDEKARLARKIQAASEKLLIANDDEDEEAAARWTRLMNKYRKQFDGCPEFEDYDREDIQIADPFEYCAKTLKDAHKRVMTQLKAKKFEMYIGGSENFRLQLPLPLQYKVSARKDGIRPIHLTGAKDFLMNHFDGYKVKGIEADDVLQMRAFQLASQGVKVIMYSNDKDRLQGWYGKYFNPDNLEIIELKSLLGECTEKKKGSGLKWLLFQVSQGDPIDGYSPKEWYSKRYGQVGFYKDFNDCKTVPEFLTKFIEVHRDRQLPKEIYEWDTWDGRHVRSNWLGIIELMFSCAYMKLSVDDKTTFSSLCSEHGVDAGELIFEVTYNEVDNTVTCDTEAVEA